MATSSPRRPSGNGIRTIAALAKEIGSKDGVPILVLRVPNVERVAWREGRAAARVLERRCLRTFREAGSRVLRGGDILAHDDESEIFVAALTIMPRDGCCVALPTDCRAALTRLAVAMERDVDIQVESGWVIARDWRVRDPELRATIEAALERGSRERERYAFFSMIGHELRTPLTSICGYLDTLLDEELSTTTARSFLEIVHAEALRMGRLVEGMFSLSMLDLGETMLRTEDADVVQTISAAIDAMAPFAALKRVMIAQHSCGALRASIGSDRLMQVLRNLLENAVKHSSEGGSVWVDARRIDERYMEISVVDDGPGVPLAQREAIFALGERGGSTLPGTGIGLAIARLIVERCGGEIDVTDSWLGGALFRVRLPIAGAE